MAIAGRHLRDYEVGESFTGFFVLRSRELRTRRDGAPYIVMEFGDCSGRLFGNIWDDAERLYHDFETGCIVKMQATIESYRGTNQVSIKRIRNLVPEDDVDNRDFIEATTIDVDKAYAKLCRIVGGFKNTHLQELLNTFLDDPEFEKSFKRAPGGKLWHHNRIGGLIEHTVAVLRLCRMMSRFYPEADTDLMVSGAILHDIGKIEEYRYDTAIDYTEHGRLVGHITIGASWVSEKAANIKEFPQETLDRLIHLILSHQGELAHGSPVQPSTREAFLLHFADLIDSKMDALSRIRRKIPDDERWTFVKLLGRYIDVGDPKM